MNLKKKLTDFAASPYLMSVLRLFLAWSFFNSGWEKITHLDAFISIVKAYRILPDWMAPIFGTLLPFAELLVAFWMLFGVLLKYASALTALMMLSFMIATVVNLLRGTKLESCGCFELSEYEEGFGWHTFFRQVGYMATAGLVFWGKHTVLSLEHWLRTKKERDLKPEA